jgi:non-ribosomal peptide synthetase component F
VADTFSTAISSMLSSSHDTSIDSIRLTSHNAIEAIREWNSVAPMPCAPPRCVHEIITDRARQDPLSPAISAWDGSVSYHELEDLSTQLALILIARGVGAGALVPLCSEKSMWVVVSMLAILKAGAAYVPLDVRWPATRQFEVLAQTQANVMLASVQHADRFSHVCNTIVVDAAALLTLPASSSSLPGADHSNAACVLFTSGSTGRPKGVVLEHLAVSIACLQFGKTLRINSTSRVLQST